MAINEIFLKTKYELNKKKKDKNKGMNIKSWEDKLDPCKIKMSY